MSRNFLDPLADALASAHVRLAYDTTTLAGTTPQHIRTLPNGTRYVPSKDRAHAIDASWRLFASASRPLGLTRVCRPR